MQLNRSELILWDALRSQLLSKMSQQGHSHVRSRKIRKKRKVRVKKYGQLGTPTKRCAFPKNWLFITLLRKAILQSSYLITANFIISSLPWQQPPSHTSKATVAGTRDEEEKKRTGRQGKDAAVLCTVHSGARWFFCPSLKKQKAECIMSRQHLMKGWAHRKKNKTWIKSDQTKCLRPVNSSRLRQLL